MYKFCPFCAAPVGKVLKYGFKCPKCFKNVYFNSKPTSSVIPIFKDEILVSVRRDDPFKGGLDIIGGFLQLDEDPISGIIREFKEETGVRLNKKDLEYLGTWVGDYIFEEVKYYTLNVTYTIKFSHKPDFKPSDDVLDLIWLKINKPIQFAFKYQKDVLRKLREI